jgi:hypothetical protein
MIKDSKKRGGKIYLLEMKELGTIMCDDEDHHVGVPYLTCGCVGVMQFLAFSCCGAGWDDLVG